MVWHCYQVGKRLDKRWHLEFEKRVFHHSIRVTLLGLAGCLPSMIMAHPKATATRTYGADAIVISKIWTTQLLPVGIFTCKDLSCAPLSDCRSRYFYWQWWLSLLRHLMIDQTRGIDPRLSSANRSLFPMSTAPDWTCESPVPEPLLYILNHHQDVLQCDDTTPSTKGCKAVDPTTVVLTIDPRHKQIKLPANTIVASPRIV